MYDTQQIALLYLRIDFHGEEEPEVCMWAESMQFLLQGDEPLRCQMYVLQEYPSKKMENFVT